MGTHRCWAALLLSLLLLAPTSRGQGAEEAELEMLRERIEALSAELTAETDRLESLIASGALDAAAEVQVRIQALLEEQLRLLTRMQKLLSEAAGAPPPPEEPPDELDEVISAGLGWLAAHQEEDGHWEPETWWKRSGIETVDGLGEPVYAIGVTGLALLAFLEAGHTHRHGEYRVVVRRACDYLAEQQGEYGVIGPTNNTHHYVYNHAIATLAMVRHYHLTHSSVHKKIAQQGVNYIAGIRNPGAAWRYGVRPGDNDVSVTGWMVAALEAARAAGLKFDKVARGEAREWVDRITDPETGKVGYNEKGTGPARPSDMVRRFPPHKSAANTAEGIAIRLSAGIDPGESALTRRGAARIRERPPVWDPAGGSIDMYYWLWATHTTHRLGGEDWAVFRERLRAILISHQAKGERVAGSWDPVGPWGSDGGRVYSTAVMTLIATSVRDDKSWVGPAAD